MLPHCNPYQGRNSVIVLDNGVYTSFKAIQLSILSRPNCLFLCSFFYLLSEGDDDAETGIADVVGGIRDAQIGIENAVLASGVVPATPEQEIVLDPTLDVRWRAFWGDLERNAIA